MASNLPYMKTNPKFIFFTDFDGTITLHDSNDYLTDNLGYGKARRRELNIEILENRWKFRDAFKDMLDSVKDVPFETCVKVLCDNIKLDPHFAEFYAWTLKNNIPVVVLSSGIDEIIRALLTKLIGPTADRITVVSNQKTDLPNGKWEIKFHDDSDFGHDKSLEIRPYAKLPSNLRPTLFYAGDGVSDLSAARETDLLFAKKGYDLVTYCERENVPFTLFEDWSTIFATCKSIVEGKSSLEDVAAAGRREADEPGGKPEPAKI